jgi:HK97 family phage major capsid protein
MKALVEKREELAVKQKALHDIFDEAGDDLDLTKVKSLEGDSRQRAQSVKALNDELTALGKEVEELQAIEDARENTKKIGDALNTPAGKLLHPNGGGGDGGGQKPVKSIGDLFVESQAYKDWHRGMGVGPVAELDIGAEEASIGLKTVMSTGAGFAPETIRIGRIIEEALRPIQVLDLIPPGTTTQAAVVYMEETTATSGAAETPESAEGSLQSYGESALAFTERSSTVRKIATFLPVTDEQLEDVAQIRDFINMRLSFFLRQRLDGQVLVGNGVAPNLAGILNTSGIQTQAKGTDPVPDAIYKAMTKIRVTGRALPSGVVLHPNDWQDIRLLRTADGVYIWGSPSEAGPERIWGLPVAQSDVITENTGLAGDFRAFCQLFVRRGIEVQISNSHASYFIQGVQAVRADMRAAFPVYRPAAFCSVTGI